MRVLDRILSVLIALGLPVLATGASAAPVIEGTYYEDNTSASCGSLPFCDATFSTIPNRQLVLITRTLLATSKPVPTSCRLPSSASKQQREQSTLSERKLSPGLPFRR